MNSFNKKGFVITLSTILLLSVLVYFSLYYVKKIQRSESDILSNFALEKAGFVADDITFDLNKLLGTALDINRSDENTVISFTDKLPSDINKLKLFDLNSFIDKNYSMLQNAEIDVNFQRLLDGKTELLFSNRLKYDYTYQGDDNSIMFFVLGADTNALRFDINIYVDTNSMAVNLWDWNSEGDIFVNLHYEDTNAANIVDASGSLSRYFNQQFDVNFSEAVDDVLTLSLGNIDGNIGSLRITQSIDNPEAQATIIFSVTIPSPDFELIAEYDADFNYVQADVNINKRFEIFRS